MGPMQVTSIALGARSVFASARTATTLGVKKVSNFYRLYYANGTGLLRMFALHAILCAWHQQQVC
jgi:hypothetical protein